MENSKLITSQDVQFFEDSSPSELAVMDIGAPTVSTGNLNDFIDDAINRECKGTPPSQPLDGMTTLQSYSSLFTSDT